MEIAAGPWPEDSWALTPMHDEHGWCRSCGVPKRTQCGFLILQLRDFKSVEGAWVPNWRFDGNANPVASARSANERWTQLRTRQVERSLLPGIERNEHWIRALELRKTITVCPAPLYLVQGVCGSCQL
jgi:hypothetical protein